MLTSPPPISSIMNGENGVLLRQSFAPSSLVGLGGSGGIGLGNRLSSSNVGLSLKERISLKPSTSWDFKNLTKGSVPPSKADIVLVGNGPSSLLLSLILSGFWPYYAPALTTIPDEYDLFDQEKAMSFTTIEHPNQLLHDALMQKPDAPLFAHDLEELSLPLLDTPLAFRSTAPIALLHDTLVRPLVDTRPGEKSRLVWLRNDPVTGDPHPTSTFAVLGASEIGGMWADMDTDDWCRTLSAASHVELPLYPLKKVIQYNARVKGASQDDSAFSPRSVASGTSTSFLSTTESHLGSPSLSPLPTTGKRRMTTEDKEDDPADYVRPKRFQVSRYFKAYAQQLKLDQWMYPRTKVVEVTDGTCTCTLKSTSRRTGDASHDTQRKDISNEVIPPLNDLKRPASEHNQVCPVCRPGRFVIKGYYQVHSTPNARKVHATKVAGMGAKVIPCKTIAVGAKGLLPRNQAEEESQKKADGKEHINAGDANGDLNNAENSDGKASRIPFTVQANYVVWATGGLGVARSLGVEGEVEAHKKGWLTYDLRDLYRHRVKSRNSRTVKGRANMTVINRTMNGPSQTMIRADSKESKMPSIIGAAPALSLMSAQFPRRTGWSRGSGLPNNVVRPMKIGSISAIDGPSSARMQNRFSRGQQSQVAPSEGRFQNALPPALKLTQVLRPPSGTLPILVIGSGFSSADAVLYYLKETKIPVCHAFFDPKRSALSKCPRSTYPEYWTIYHLMKEFSQHPHTNETHLADGKAAPTTLAEMSRAAEAAEAAEAAASASYRMQSASTMRQGLMRFQCNLSNSNVPGEQNPLSNRTVKDQKKWMLDNKTQVVPHEDYIGLAGYQVVRIISPNLVVLRRPKIDPVSGKPVTKPNSEVGLHEKLDRAEDLLVLPVRYMHVHIGRKPTIPCESFQRYSYRLKDKEGCYAVGSVTGDRLVRFVVGGAVGVGADLYRERRENEGRLAFS